MKIHTFLETVNCQLKKLSTNIVFKISFYGIIFFDIPQN